MPSVSQIAEILNVEQIHVCTTAVHATPFDGKKLCDAMSIRKELLDDLEQRRANLRPGGGESRHAQAA